MIGSARTLFQKLRRWWRRDDVRRENEFLPGTVFFERRTFLDVPGLLTGDDERYLDEAIDKLAADGIVVRVDGGRYALKDRAR